MCVMGKTDTSKDSRAIVSEIYRGMPVTEKVRLIFDAYETGKKLAIAGLRQRYPDASERRIWYLWAKQHLGDELFRKVYGEVRDE